MDRRCRFYKTKRDHPGMLDATRQHLRTCPLSKLSKLEKSMEGSVVCVYEAQQQYVQFFPKSRVDTVWASCVTQAVKYIRG